jgi:hypothetical protein
MATTGKPEIREFTTRAEVEGLGLKITSPELSEGHGVVMAASGEMYIPIGVVDGPTVSTSSSGISSQQGTSAGAENAMLQDTDAILSRLEDGIAKERKAMDDLFERIRQRAA